MAFGSRTRILLADDHPLVCNALRAMLEAEFEVVGAVHRGDHVYGTVLSLHPDLMLLDVSLPGRNGIDVARQLRRECPELRIILLTMHTDKAFVDEAWRIGVHGYALKISDATELTRCIHEVLSGRRYLSPTLLPSRVASDSAQCLLKLSVRQTEVLRLIAEGATAPEIGRRLGIGSKTVDYHRIAIKRRLGLRSTADLIRFAISAEIVDPAG